MTKKKAAAKAVVTKTAKIKLTTDVDADAAIKLKCEAMGNLGYRLAATFTHVNLLILIFQK